MITIANKPPEFIEINKKRYDIEWDFLPWVNVVTKLQEMDFTDIEQCIRDICAVEKIIFKKIINEPFQDVLEKIIEFSKGYPKKSNGYAGNGTLKNGEKVYSFKHDLNFIILAIRNQSGIDLTYKRNERFHFWDFLLEFQSLTDNHYICKIMTYRSYDGKDKDLMELKKMYALPKEYTKSEQKLIEQMDKIFYNT